jgi:hypothetical protein
VLHPIGTAGLALVLLAAPGRPPAPSADARRLESLARQVVAADYSGDRAELRRLVTALHEVREPGLQAYRGYWQGFAHWRRAVNGFNEKPFPPDLKDDLQAAIASFRSALGDRPDWIEPKIAMAGASAGLLFLTADDPVRHEQILKEFLPVYREMAAQGTENPRALWIIGGSELGAPPPYGGKPEKASATFLRGVAAARREAQHAPEAAYVPTWGGPENMMSLAWLYGNSTLKNRDLALAYAEGALAAVPHWHYVRDILLPQIAGQPATAASTE